MTINPSADKLLAELLHAWLSKDPAPAAKRQRLLEKLQNPAPGATEAPSKLGTEHQQHMADAVAAKLWPMNDSA